MSDPPDMTSRPRDLSRESLEALLTRLDPDRDRAATLYRTIHSRLCRLYEWRGCSSPEELADETLDRVASKLEQGVEINSPEHYIARVAYLVFRELVRREQRKRAALEAERYIAEQNTVEQGSTNDLSSCFSACLKQFETTDREHLLRYYEGDKSVKIANRRGLREELGIAAGTLRIRMHRMRLRLEECVYKCLARLGKETDPPASTLY